jgi:uncharacterized protein YciI
MSKEFIYVLKLAKSRSEKLSPADEAVVEKHFDRLKKALADCKLIFAGPCEDKAFGVVVFRAQSSEDAEKFMKDDPAVEHGIMTAELHPFHVSLAEKRQSQEPNARHPSQRRRSCRNLHKLLS